MVNAASAPKGNGASEPSAAAAPYSSVIRVDGLVAGEVMN